MQLANAFDYNLVYYDDTDLIFVHEWSKTKKPFYFKNDIQLLC